LLDPPPNCDPEGYRDTEAATGDNEKGEERETEASSEQSSHIGA